MLRTAHLSHSDSQHGVLLQLRRGIWKDCGLLQIKKSEKGYIFGWLFFATVGAGKLVSEQRSQSSWLKVKDKWSKQAT